MKFEKAFRGFYLSKGDKGKEPILKYKTDEQLKDFNNRLVGYNEADKQFNSFVGYLADDYVLVDLDNKDSQGEYDSNKTESKKLIEIYRIMDHTFITSALYDSEKLDEILSDYE